MHKVKGEHIISGLLKLGYMLGAWGLTKITQCVVLKNIINITIPVKGKTFLNYN